MGMIETERELRGMYLQPKERAVKKQLSRLDKHCENFLALARFAVLSTCDADGNMDASPRGGEPGFVKVIDEHTLILPDWAGNNRLDTFSNVVATGRIGAIFFVPGVDEALRVNGMARLTNDEKFVSRCEVNGRFPKVVVHITVKEAYLHCAKAIMRAQLWVPEARVERSALPTMNEMLRDQVGPVIVPETQEETMARHKTELYLNR